MINDGIIGIAVYHDGYDDDNTFNFMVIYPARALRALGLLLADGAPTVEGGKTF